MGSGSYCGCNCKCCPPCPCYTSWTYVYVCGSPSYGCCTGPVATFNSPSLPDLDVEFPEFEYPSYMFNIGGDTGEVFAQNTAPPVMDYTTCSIPCSTITITLTTSGCCLFGSGFSFTAIGAGTVSLSGCGSACNGTFYCSINGGGPSVNVDDCGGVGVSITPPSSYCCSCCLISSYGTLLGQCAGVAPYRSFAFQQRSVTTGMKKTYLNKENILERIKAKTRLKKR